MNFLSFPVPLLLALLLAVCGLAQADSSSTADNVTFHQAVKAEQAGELETAFRHYQVLARQGDDRAQFNLGSFFINGELVNQDLTEGLAWIYLSVASFGEDAPWNRAFALEQLENQVPESAQHAARLLASAWEQRFGTGQRTFDADLLGLPRLVVSTRKDCSAPTGSHLKRCRKQDEENDPFVTVIEANGLRQPNSSVYNQ